MIIQRFEEDLTGVVDNMSIEYQLIIDNESLNDVFNDIKISFERNNDFKICHSVDDSIGVSANESDSKWGADIEISKNSEGIFIDIHSGNRKRILKFIEDILFNNNIIFEIEEN